MNGELLEKASHREEEIHILTLRIREHEQALEDAKTLYVKQKADEKAILDKLRAAQDTQKLEYDKIMDELELPHKWSE